MNKVKRPGDPDGRSPSQVAASEAYEWAPSSWASNHCYPPADEYVAWHMETDTYWRCLCAVRDDDSDWDVGASWTQVIKVERTVVDYKAIK
jgi:hypothetical protein